MEILVIVRLCCNCTYGEGLGAVGRWLGVFHLPCWGCFTCRGGAGRCPCWLEAASCSAA